jgi:hypothetical protein
MKKLVLTDLHLQKLISPITPRTKAIEVSATSPLISDMGLKLTDRLESLVCQRYHIQKPSDYASYNRLCGQIRSLAHRLSSLSPDDAFRRTHEELLLEKCFEIGVLGTGGGGRGKLSGSTFSVLPAYTNH